jgi:Tetracyclin repressor-like, C-terminal domain
MGLDPERGEGKAPRVSSMDRPNATDRSEGEVAAGAYEPSVEVETLAYAIVRLAEAFIFNDARAAVRGDVDRLREIEAALLRARASGTPGRS